MILPIYTYGQGVLRKECEEIDATYPQLPQLISDMWETLDKSEGIGLAAPLVGLPIRLVVIDLTPLGIMEIVRQKGEKSLEEILKNHFT